MGGRSTKTTMARHCSCIAREQNSECACQEPGKETARFHIQHIVGPIGPGRLVRFGYGFIFPYDRNRRLSATHAFRWFTGYNMSSFHLFQFIGPVGRSSLGVGQQFFTVRSRQGGSTRNPV
jgi:hypothetical protein